MLLSKISLDLLKKPLEEMEKIRKEKFWSSDLLSQFDKNSVKYFTLQQYLLWFLAFLAQSNFGAPSFTHSEFICRSYWSLNLKRAYKLFYYLYSIFGYYIGNTVEMYHAYAILHSHFQIKMINFYIQRELTMYEDMPFKEKIYSSSYQEAVQDILLKSIQQYQFARRYMNIASSMCNSVAPFHFLAGIPVISIGMYGILFVSILQKFINIFIFKNDYRILHQT